MVDVGVRRQHLRQRRERQAQSERRIAAERVETLATQRPAAAVPVDGCSVGDRLQRQHVADGPGESLPQQAGKARALVGLGEVGRERVAVDGERRLDGEEVRDVLVRGDDEFRGESQRAGEPGRECLRRLDVQAARGAGVGDQRGLAPQRLAVGPPVDAQRPARQRFAGIPLALPRCRNPSAAKRSARRRIRISASSRFFGDSAVLFHSGPSMSSTDTNVGSPPWVSRTSCAGEIVVDAPAERVDRRPLRLGVRPRDPRILVHARHAHREVELDLAGIGEADDRRGIAGIGGAGERQVAFAGEQPRRRVEPDPAGAGQEDLGPGVQVGEVVVGAGRSVERLHVGDELDQVARGEPRREPQVTHDLHQQPAAVAAGAAGALQRLLGRLHARLHAHQVADRVLQLAVEPHQHVDGVLAGGDRGAEALDEGGETRPHRRRLEERDQFLGERRRVAERIGLGVRLDEEVERVDHRHVGGDVDDDLQVVGGFGEDDAGDPVAVGILLPVEEVPGRRDVERVPEHRRAAVRRRAQPDLVRRDRDAAVEAVGGAVLQRDADGHRFPEVAAPRLRPSRGWGAARTPAAGPRPTGCAPSGSRDRSPRSRRCMRTTSASVS